MRRIAHDSYDVLDENDHVLWQSTDYAKAREFAEKKEAAFAPSDNHENIIFDYRPEIPSEVGP